MSLSQVNLLYTGYVLSYDSGDYTDFSNNRTQDFRIMLAFECRYLTSGLMCWVNQVDPFDSLHSLLFCNSSSTIFVGVHHLFWTKPNKIYIIIYIYIHISYIYILYHICIHILYKIIYIYVDYVSHELCPRRGWFHNTTKNGGKSL